MATPQRRVRNGDGCGGLGRVNSASDAACVLAVEQRPMLSQIADVVAHACEPFERVQGLEVLSERRVHPRAVEDGLVAVEVDGLLEGEGVSDEEAAVSSRHCLSKAGIGSPT